MQLIIEECKFYQNYPDTEITIAGQLLGKIVLKVRLKFNLFLPEGRAYTQAKIPPFLNFLVVAQHTRSSRL